MNLPTPSGLSGGGSAGAAADQGDDLDGVAVAQAVLGVLGARDDVAVDLDGHASRVVAEVLEQLGDGQRVGEGVAARR